MGLDYSYFLYFHKNQLEAVLQGLAEMSITHEPPTVIHFPNHVLEIPIESWQSEKKTIRYDDPDFSFDAVMVFELDDAIMDWGHAQPVDKSFRSPPGTSLVEPVSVGYIYLTVYNDMTEFFPEIDLKDLVLFDFGTTGTRMSTMFAYSTSIRERLLELLKKYDGECGVFNNEENGEVFWLNGREMKAYIDDPRMLPDEIEQELLER